MYLPRRSLELMSIKERIDFLWPSPPPPLALYCTCHTMLQVAGDQRSLLKLGPKLQAWIIYMQNALERKSGKDKERREREGNWGRGSKLCIIGPRNCQTIEWEREIFVHFVHFRQLLQPSMLTRNCIIMAGRTSGQLNSTASAVFTRSIEGKGREKRRQVAAPKKPILTLHMPQAEACLSAAQLNCITWIEMNRQTAEQGKRRRKRQQGRCSWQRKRQAEEG